MKRVSDVGGKFLVQLLAKARELYPDDLAAQSRYVRRAMQAKRQEHRNAPQASTEEPS